MHRRSPRQVRSRDCVFAIGAMLVLGTSWACGGEPGNPTHDEGPGSGTGGASTSVGSGGNDRNRSRDGSATDDSNAGDDGSSSNAAGSGGSNAAGSGGSSGVVLDAGGQGGMRDAASGQGGVGDSGPDRVGDSGQVAEAGNLTDASAAKDGAGGTGVAEAIHYHGRWNRLSDRVVTVNSGSYVTAQFSGTSLSARFDVFINDPTDLPTVAWRIDQAPTWQVDEVASTISMGGGLSAGTHTVTLIARGLDENKNRWVAPLVSSISFLGLTVTGGALEPTVEPAQPKIEFLGDSITEGVVVHGSSYEGHSGQCWKNDAVNSYPTLTGMQLRADYRQVGFGYQGLLKEGNGGVPAAND